MARRVLVDSGSIVALLDRRDLHHQWVQHELATLHEPLVTCEAVLSEVFFLVSRSRHGTSALIALLRDRLISTTADFSYANESTEFCVTWKDIRMFRCHLLTPVWCECVKSITT